MDRKGWEGGMGGEATVNGLSKEHLSGVVAESLTLEAQGEGQGLGPEVLCKRSCG